MAYDLAIVGGGTAGASAAIFAGRAGLQTLVIDADKGMTRRAWLENHLGFPDVILGPELVERAQVVCALLASAAVDGVGGGGGKRAGSEGGASAGPLVRQPPVSCRG